MCRSKEHSGRRCSVTDRERAMAAARRQILRINQRLEEGVSSKEERQRLVNKGLVAKKKLEDARKTKKPTKPVKKQNKKIGENIEN